MVRIMVLLLLLAGCSSVPGDAEGSGPVTAQVDLSFRPVLEVMASTQPEPPDILADGTGTLYRLGPAIGDMTRFENIQATLSQYGEWVVEITLGPEDTRAFGDWTTAHVGEQFAIVVGEEIVSAPVIQSAITDGDVQISGLTRQEAEALAQRITG